jgi:hypothetical protein
MLTFIEGPEGNVLRAEASGRLTHADRAEFLSRLESLAGEFGRVRVLVELKRFEGVEPCSGWDDPTSMPHDKAMVKRFALVGPKKARAWMKRAAEPFTEVKLFAPGRRAEAEAWACEGARGEADLQRVRRRAYERWEAAGRPCDDGLRFWAEAERELCGACEVEGL